MLLPIQAPLWHVVSWRVLHANGLHQTLRAAAAMQAVGLSWLTEIMAEGCLKVPYSPAGM